MKFKVDENLPVEVAEVLRDAGHDAVTVVEEGLGGREDKAIRRLQRLDGAAVETPRQMARAESCGAGDGVVD